MAIIERILVPTDFSETAEIAMAYASELSNGLGATLHVLHVIEDVTPTGGMRAGEVHQSPPSPLIQPMKEQTLGELKKEVAKLQPQPLKFTQTVKDGSPLVEIIRYVRDRNVDLIVMGTHGRGPVAHLLLGSVAENVIRHAPCPVLTVRHPQHTFVKL
jgi:nucleotide-binding universal stress UspA family protein